MHTTEPSKRHAIPITRSSGPAIEGDALGPPGLSPGGARSPLRGRRALALRV